MVSAWWMILAFLLGAYAGMLVMAVMAVAKDLPRKAVRVPAFHVRRRALHATHL